MNRLQKLLTARATMAGLLTFCLVGALLCRVVTATAGPQAPVLQSVTARTLSASGITLAPPNHGPSISADQAQAVALEYYPGSQVRERVLAVVNDTHVYPAINRLCWIVSIVPPGGIWSYGRGIRGTYDLLLIDADTGQYFFGTKGGEVQ